MLKKILNEAYREFESEKKGSFMKEGRNLSDNIIRRKRGNAFLFESDNSNNRRSGFKFIYEKNVGKPYEYGDNLNVNTYGDYMAVPTRLGRKKRIGGERFKRWKR